MFRDYINTPIDPIPEQYVETLQRLESEPDYSLTCLGIALLRPRIKDYKGIGGAYRTFQSGTTCVLNLLEECNLNTQEVPRLYFYKYNTSFDIPDDVHKTLHDNGFVVKENIGTFLKAKTNTEGIAVYHKEKNIAAFFVNSLDIRIYHILISFISLLFPKLFEEMPLRKPEDYDVIVALSKTSKDAFIEKIQKAVQPFVSEFRRLMLGSLLKMMHDGKINAALAEVTNQRMYLDELERGYSEAYKVLQRLIVTYEGLKATEGHDEVEEELVEYLSSNKNIRNLAINDGKLSFTVATVLNGWNENVWETFHKRGFIYDGVYGRAHVLDVFKDKNNRKLLLNNIFSESAEFTVKMAGNYSIDLNNCYVTSRRGYDYTIVDPVYKSYLPNPHLNLFACLGAYKERIIKCVRNRNYISAIELCCASAGSVNLEETEQTFRPFVGSILSSREKILRRKDGVEMTPEEALVYLVDKNK